MVKNVSVKKIFFFSKKKSQIFTFDLILATVILVVAVVITLSYFSDSVSNANLVGLNQRILNDFTQTQVNSLNGVEIRQMFINGDIKNIHNTIAQQVVDFVSNSNIILAQNLTKFFVKGYLSKNFNFNLSLTNSSGSVITLFYLNNNGIKFKDCVVSSDFKRKIISFTNVSKGYEIYTFEVKMWQ